MLQNWEGLSQRLLRYLRNRFLTFTSEKRFDNTGGTVGSEFQVNTFTTNFQARSSVAMDANGNFVIALDSLVLYRKSIVSYSKAR